MKAQIITLSRSKTLLHCCIIMFVIASAVSVIGQVGISEFVNNLLLSENFF